jgi:O-succinylhomoserine sulfhydrylase
VLGGAVVSSRELKEEKLKPFMRHTGPSLSPFNAWVLLKGMETLKLRVMAQCEIALKVATALEGMQGVARVTYPWLDSHPQAALCRKQMKAGGTMVTFELSGGKQAAFDMLRKLEIIDISNNLGDAKSLITHPATTTHRNIGQAARDEMGVSDGMVRLSVGLEETDDLIADLKQALGA